MSDITTHLLLPYILASQAQKHVTHNEALRLLDAMIQLSVLDRNRTTPPASPTDGDRHIVATGATGLWAGWDLNVAFWVDGVWMRLVPRPGWLAWIADEAAFVVWTSGAWEPLGLSDGILTAERLGLGGAVADGINRLSVNSPAVLLNNAGAGIEATVNKVAAGNDAAFAFKTGFSARALVGLLASDDLSVKVSPNGTTFHDALKIDRNSGRVELPEPLLMPGLAAAPAPPPTGKLALYARDRAGTGWLDVQHPSGRFLSLQPHFGVNRIATWSPSSGTTVTASGMPRTSVGTVTTPTLTASNLSSSIRRWRVTSAATADSAAEERATGWVCWRGNTEGLGGWTYVARLSLSTIVATGMAFFGLCGATTALPTTQVLDAMVNCIGIGFQRGTHGRWNLVHNDATGTPTLIDLGASFPVNSMTNVLTLYLAAAPNGSDIGVRVVEEVSGAAIEFTVVTDLPAPAQFLSPRNYMNNGLTAAAVAYDCAGLYLETDY